MPSGLSGNRFAAFLSDDDDEEESRLKPVETGKQTRKRLVPDAAADNDCKRGRGKRKKKRRTQEAATNAAQDKVEDGSGSMETAAADTPHPSSENELLEGVTESTAKTRKLAKAPLEACAVGTKHTKPGGVVTEVLRAAPPGAVVAKNGMVVRLNYEGKLPAKDMKRFDASDIDFVLGDGSMVRGFDYGVGGMGVGEKRRIFIPSKMGYGKKGKKPKVPPHSDLVFDVVLIHAGVDWNAPSRTSAMSIKRREAARRRGKKNRAV